MINGSEVAPEFKKLKAQQNALTRTAAEQREVQKNLRKQFNNSSFFIRHRLAKQMEDLNVKIANTDRRAAGVDHALDRLIQKFQEEHKEAIDKGTNCILELQSEQQEFRQRLRRAIEEVETQEKLDTELRSSSESALPVTTPNSLGKEDSTRAGFSPKPN
jgi:hypothetical protein